jgi:SAM-dependent methyltransferase
VRNDTAVALASLNNAFYAAHADSFASTRRSAWPGWVRCAQQLRDCWGAGDPRLSGEVPLRVLDVACGTLRFERYLREAFPEANLRVTALDSCPQLVCEDGLEDVAIEYHCIDIVRALLGQAAKTDAWLGVPAGAFDIVACFGFFHHVPGAANRDMLADALLRARAPKGALAVSLWRFMDDAGLAAKARIAHEQAQTALPLQGESLDFSDLEPGDWIIGWQGRPGAYRYCHSFDDGDATLLREHMARVQEVDVACFRADGRTHALNEYLMAYSATALGKAMQS